MRDFGYAKATDTLAAARVGGEPGVMFLAGGTELVNLVRLGIIAPDNVIDLSELAELAVVERSATGLHVGALARLGDVARHPAVVQGYPVLAQAIDSAASAQLRNRATMGGNLLQRTRCPYFRAEAELPCNKRRPGAGCSAIDGENRNHAIFGWSPDCVAVQPSDVAVALACLDAEIHLLDPAGTRRAVMATDFHSLPGGNPDRDNVLATGELITHYRIPAHPTAALSAYVKVRERASYEYAIVSAAAAISVDDVGRIIAARLALGSVAARPWRLTLAEERLRGLSVHDEAAVRSAIGTAGDFDAARALSGNAHKVELAKRAAARALLDSSVATQRT